MLLRGWNPDAYYALTIPSLKWIWFIGLVIIDSCLVIKKTVGFNFAIISLDTFNFWVRILSKEQHSRTFKTTYHLDKQGMKFDSLRHFFYVKLPCRNFHEHCHILFFLSFGKKPTFPVQIRDCFSAGSRGTFKW